jgi:glycerol-3-phosphate acyltransferase PlsY
VDIFIFASILAIAYFLGGIPFGWLVARAFGVTDIRAHGSGNIGATNVWRTLGPKAGAWVYVGDIGKGVLAVLLARSVHQNLIPPDYFLVLTALAAVTGHVFSIYLAFRGGKGVSTALGVMITLLPWHTLIALAAFILTVTFSKYISLGSVVAAVALFLTTLIEKLTLFPDRSVIYTLLAAALMLLVVYTHRANLSRVFAGIESKFSFSGGKGPK